MTVVVVVSSEGPHCCPAGTHEVAALLRAREVTWTLAPAFYADTSRRRVVGKPNPAA